MKAEEKPITFLGAVVRISGVALSVVPFEMLIDGWQVGTDPSRVGLLASCTAFQEWRNEGCGENPCHSLEHRFSPWGRAILIPPGTFGNVAQDGPHSKESPRTECQYCPVQ